jgi:tellurite resistance protein TerC
VVDGHVPGVHTPFWVWATFAAVLGVLLAVDLIVHRGAHGRSHKAAIAWTVIWIAVGLLFTVFVAVVLGSSRSHEYLGAYLIEKSLSLDNLFVFLVIFKSLGIPQTEQRHVLSWGIFGALLFRLVFVVVGVAVMEKFHWVRYVFAAILLVAAVRLLRPHGPGSDESRVVRWLSRHIPVTADLHGAAFFVREAGRRVATPLAVALAAVELTDIAFAVDSVPAALAISDSTFVIYSSNAFAILGLRSLYVVLEQLLGTLRYLQYGLAAVLAFAGVKLIAAEWIHLPPLVSVGIIAACIGVAVLASLRGRSSAPPRETNT